MLYRKLPIIIEAQLFDRDKKHLLSNEFREAICNCGSQVGVSINWHIHTLEGLMAINDLDYIIKGIKGEFYPCKPDIFKTTYEVVV